MSSYLAEPVVAGEVFPILPWAFSKSFLFCKRYVQLNTEKSPLPQARLFLMLSSSSTLTLTLSVPIDTLLRSLLKDLQQQAEVDRLGALKVEEKEDSVAGSIPSDPAEGSQESHGRGAEGQPREQADAPAAMLQGDLLLLGSFAAGCPQEGEIARVRD